MGCCVPRRSTSAETDGPIGAVQLAAAVQALGGIRIVTDELCMPVVRAAVVAAGLSVEFGEPASDTTYAVAIERVGPSWGGGPPRNMRVEDVSEWTEPHDRLYTKGFLDEDCDR